jgi:hypothetical protein
MIVDADDVDMQKYPEKQTLTGVVYAYANRGQFEIQRQCEEALDNIWHLLSDDAKDEVKEIAPDFCKERKY